MSENRLLSSVRTYSGRLLNIDLDEVRLESGARVHLEIIRHPGAAAVVPLVGTGDPDPDIILIRQFRHAASGTIWEIPAGVLNPGEEPVECARRELAEETGVVADAIEHMGTILTTPGFTDEKIHLFMATGLRQGITRLEDDEQIETVTLPFSRAVQMVLDGTICDSKSIAGILLARERLRSQDPGVRFRTQ